jgi:hypothetical protein
MGEEMRIHTSLRNMLLQAAWGARWLQHAHETAEQLGCTIIHDEIIFHDEKSRTKFMQEMARFSDENAAPSL